MASDCYQFDGFVLEPGQRRLSHDGVTVEINGRYLDALALLVSEAGQLITKERFFQEVWRGAPVTDEALTQCIRTLRRCLNDRPIQPRFIETVPRHGYRFIAHVVVGECVERVPIPDHVQPSEVTTTSWMQVGRMTGFCALGGGIAGITGGFLYAILAASGAPSSEVPAVFMVMLGVCSAVGLLGGAGVGFGIGVAGSYAPPWRIITGGALGGLVLGAFVEVFGIGAFSLIAGTAPSGVTGALEGAAIGTAVGLSLVYAERKFRRAGRPVHSVKAGMHVAGMLGALTGGLIILAGGQMLAGSLNALHVAFPTSRLRLDLGQVGLQATGFEWMIEIASGALEGGIFSLCLLWALRKARTDRSPIGGAK
jgi:DNA-binding winged helix-turn-helix (wHTH) protein